MPKKVKTGKNRLDKYYYLAKEQGFRARSAFKLIQLNKKYDFLSGAKVLIDLCAAPGGWLQVAQKSMPSGSLIVGVDLAAIRPIPGVITMAEDITSDKCRSGLKRHLKDWKADVILHDGAPNVGTAWAQDAYGQNELVLHSLKLATEFLKKGGIFVSKVFRSQDYTSLLWVFQQLFEKVESTKPASSRHESAEIFVICRQFLAPDHVDPRLLDPRHVFAEVDSHSKTDDGKSSSADASNNPRVNIFMPEKQTRHRVGYDDDSMMIFKKCDVADFICYPQPIDILAVVNEISFSEVGVTDKTRYPAQQMTYPEDKKSLLSKLQKWSTDEIRACCADIKVLGKKEFRLLMKWRLSIRKKLDMDVEGQETDKDLTRKKDPSMAEKEEESMSKDEDSDTDEKLRTAVSRMKQQEKKRKRMEAERKDRLRKRLSLMLDDQSANGREGNGDDDEESTLFSLSAIQRSAVLAKKEKKLAMLYGNDNHDQSNDAEEEEEHLQNQFYDDRADELERELKEKKKKKHGLQDSDEHSEEDSDEEQQQELYSKEDYEEELSTMLDQQYDDYVERRGLKKRVDRKRQEAKEADRLRNQKTTSRDMPEDEPLNVEDERLYRDEEHEKRAAMLRAHQRQRDSIDNERSLLESTAPSKKTKTKEKGKKAIMMKVEEEEMEKEHEEKDDMADSDDDDHALNITRSVATALPTRRDMTDQWFQQSVFDHMITTNDLKTKKKASTTATVTNGKAKTVISTKKSVTAPSLSDDDEDDDIRAMNSKKNKNKNKEGKAVHNPSQDESDSDSHHGKIEFVSAQPQKNALEERNDTWTSSSSEEEDDDDQDDGSKRGKRNSKRDKQQQQQREKEHLANAQSSQGASAPMTPSQIALATLMFMKKKEHRMVDAGFHRYTHNDDNGDASSLPLWFREDEQQHRMPLKNVLQTANLVKDYADAKSVAAAGITKRPQGSKSKRKYTTKKEMEAVQRKKQRAMRVYRKITQEANAVTDNDDLSEQQKVKKLGQLYAKKKASLASGDRKQRKLSLVVAKGSNKGKSMRVPKGTKGKAKFVDSRMKKDLKAKKRQQRREKQMGRKRR